MTNTTSTVTTPAPVTTPTVTTPTVTPTETMTPTTPLIKARPLRSVARVVFPVDGDVDVLPLYVDQPQGSATTGEDGAVVSLPTRQHPDQVLSRRSYRLRPGQHATFATYFNAFPASYWRRWTNAETVSLRIRTSGRGSLVVHRSNARGTAARVTARPLRDVAEHTIELPLAAFGDGGWYWFDLIAGEGELTLDEAEWLAPAQERTFGTVTIGITTFNRPESCTALLSQLADAMQAHGELGHQVDRVLVIDQGSRTVQAEPEFAALRDLLGDRLRVIEQANVGGSGGFSRAMLEVLDDGVSDYVLLLDDDVVCEPEGIARAAAFADLARRPMLVGGHMFSMHERSVLHAFAEVVLPWQFRWGPAEPTRHDHDLARENLRATPWLHRRMDADYNGWWMCLIPTSVLREIGLSLPLFIKWDDAEYGLRAAAHGHPTVSLPGAAVWHVPWTDKDDSIDWQAYFHARNRFVAALLHSPFERGGRMVRESLFIQLKHVLAMQYSAAELRHQALVDVLAGPDQLHPTLGTKLGEIRALRADHDDATVLSDPEAFGPTRRLRPRRREGPITQPANRLKLVMAAARGILHQLTAVPPSAEGGPERHIAAVDAGWWSLSRFDSVLVSTTDGTGVSWHRRDRRVVLAAMREAIEVHNRLLREWPALAARYRAALPGLVDERAWRHTLGVLPRAAHLEPTDPADPADPAGPAHPVRDSVPAR